MHLINIFFMPRPRYSRGTQKNKRPRKSNHGLPGLGTIPLAPPAMPELFAEDQMGTIQLLQRILPSPHLHTTDRNSTADDPLQIIKKERSQESTPHQ